MQVDRWLALAPLGLALYGLLALALWLLLKRRLLAGPGGGGVERRGEPGLRQRQGGIVLALLAGALGIASGLLLAWWPLSLTLRFLLAGLAACGLALLTVTVLSEWRGAR